MNNYVMALFASGTTNFDYMGLGPLSDAISAIATETATSNGNITYTMEMSYPINGRLADKLVEGNLIKAQVSKTPGDFMIFEINETLKSDDRTITVYCDAYANRILRMSFDNGGKFGSFGNVQEALNAARAQMTGIQSDFTLSSGIGTRLNMSGVTSKNTMPTTYQDFNAYLDAIMDKVQGNVRFGVNSIQIVSDRGRDITDTVLRDDKNTNGISIKVDTSNIINRIIPILPVLDKNGNATQETKVGKIVTSSVAFKFINFYAGQVVSVDTQDLANSYFNRTNCDRPTTTATVQTSMLDEDLTDIRLFDRVQVYSSKIGYQAKLRVCERDFDILAGAVSEFKLGSSSVTVFNSQTGVINAINSAVQSSQYAAITADGKNTAYYEGTTPYKPKENDLWFHSVDGISQIDQYVNGNWVTIVSDSTGEQIRQKVDQVEAQAKAGEEEAQAAFDKATQLASKYDDTNSLASQAMLTAVSAQGDASSAVAAAQSTASEFGRVDQKADSAVASALNAQSVASDAVKQASSAAADSKDAKQIAGAVSQSYKTLTDGSTMTIAELQNGLAAKLTKADLDGYATQTWTQNQVKMTADGINGTISSIKGRVDSQTTSINDLKADSSSFKSQFTTVNDTLGKQTTDIGSLQASSKELTSGFNTLTSDNKTNKNDISQLKQTSTELTSTMETVQTQVQNSAVGTNLLKNTGDLSSTSTTSSWHTLFSSSQIYDSGIKSVSGVSAMTFSFDVYVPLNANVGDTVGIQLKGQNAQATNTGSNEWDTLIGEYRYAVKQDDLGKTIRASLSIQKDSNYQSFDTALADTASIVIRQSSDVPGFVYSRIKLEKGNVATDWCPNPADNATVTALSSLSQTVDGMKADISKKIEQKDLNGYATETWTQNKINTTADGINGTISSIKGTVDSHTTNINDLQADSRGFKAQFDTVTGTLEKHTTDIGTLQASSKSLSASFDSLSSDNQTNQHNISQLQASAKEFNSTLMTVQQRVTDSAVGTNLLLKTGASFSMTGNNTVNQVGRGYSLANGYNVSSLASAFGTQFTISFDWSVSGDSPSGKLTPQWNNVPWGISLAVTVSSSNASGHVSYTFSESTNSQNLGNAVDFRLDNFVGTLTISNVKLEKGSTATDWCPNPLDNATVDAVSSISQTIDSIQTTVRGKADMSKVTQLDNQITSVVGKVNTFGSRNIVTNSQFQYDYMAGPSWTSTNNDVWYKSDYAWSWVNGYQGICINQPVTTDDVWYNLFSRKIVIGPDISTPWSASAYVNVDTIGHNAILVVEFYDTKAVRIGFKETHKSSRGLELIKVENVVPPAGTETVCLSFRVHGGGHLAMICPMLNQGTTAAAYTPDVSTNAELEHAYSYINQTNDRITLRVEKNGVINAINVTPESIKISGNKLHITADTYIDNEIVKNSMIENLSADKITAGTINADIIQVIHLDANNITTGTIKGSNLSINLNTGNVEFQKGRIHSSDNAIDININNKYMSVADKDNRILISGGEIQMVKPTFFDRQTSPYVRISNAVAGSSWGGATFWGRDYFVVTNGANDGYFFSSPLGEEKFAGISGGHATDGSWEPTKIGGAERGVFISGGKEYNNGYISYSPFIKVGDNGHAGTGTHGSNITVMASYIYLKSPHSTSKGANAYLAPDGALVPSNSAAKYKTDIVRSFETGMGDKLLEIPVAHWKDKEEVLSKTLDPNAKNPETYFGMIADDLDDAGLNELVEYDDKGSVRGIQYDRVALALIPLIRNYRDRINELETEVKEMKEV